MNSPLQGKDAAFGLGALKRRPYNKCPYNECPITGAHLGFCGVK